jgi:hypothetical protein
VAVAGRTRQPLGWEGARGGLALLSARSGGGGGAEGMAAAGGGDGSGRRMGGRRRRPAMPSPARIFVISFFFKKNL